MTANFVVTTEEELWTTAGLEVMTDEEEGADLKVTTEELRTDQHELLTWSQRS